MLYIKLAGIIKTNGFFSLATVCITNCQDLFRLFYHFFKYIYSNKELNFTTFYQCLFLVF